MQKTTSDIAEECEESTGGPTHELISDSNKYENYIITSYQGN